MSALENNTISGRSPWEVNYSILSSMVTRNLQLKFHSSVRGFAWMLVGPLLLMALLILVFTYVVRIPIDNYWAFLISGYFAWHFFNNCVNYSANVLEEHGTLIRNFRFPCELAVVAGAISRLAEFLIEIIIIVLVLAVFHHGALTLGLIFLPLVIVLQLLLVIGPMLIIATLGAFNEDLKHMLPLFLMALFYATPIFYTVELVPNNMQWFFYLNPVAQLMICFHEILYHGTAPPLTNILLLAAQATVLCAIGYQLFDRYRGRFADVA